MTKQKLLIAESEKEILNEGKVKK